MKSVSKIGQTGSVTIDLTGLKNLLSGVQEKHVVRVGILGSKASSERQKKQTNEKTQSKEASPVTNADIGLAHEKGVKSRNLPRRSWLQNPLEDRLGEYFKMLGPKTISFILMEQPLKPYEELGLICEQIIQKGFETGGYGKWKALKQSTINAKGSDQILIDTAQLRKSVTSTVVTL